MSEDFLRRGIGLVGGTFDPVHHGHIALAQSAWEALPLARIAFVPAGNPWQKTDISSAEHRLAMLELALKDLPSDQFGVDPQELLRTGPSYSIDTLEHYRKKMGPSMPLVLILGMDQWCNLTTWHRWGDILKLSHIAVVNREMGNKTPQTLESLLKCHRVQPNELTLSSCGHITFFTMPTHRAGSTEIRNTLSRYPTQKALRKVGGFLSTEVLTYIRDHKLYGVDAQLF